MKFYDIDYVAFGEASLFRAEHYGCIFKGVCFYYDKRFRRVYKEKFPYYAKIQSVKGKKVLTFFERLRVRFAVLIAMFKYFIKKYKFWIIFTIVSVAITGFVLFVTNTVSYYKSTHNAMVAGSLDSCLEIKEDYGNVMGSTAPDSVKIKVYDELQDRADDLLYVDCDFYLGAEK